MFHPTNIPNMEPNLFTAERALQRQLRKYVPPKVAVSDTAVDQARYVAEFPPERVGYLSDYWLFIKQYMSVRYRLSGRIDFERRLLGVDPMDAPEREDESDRIRTLLSLLVRNLPFNYCVYGIQASVTVDFIRGDDMIKNDDLYFFRKHRFFTPDVRTLTYLEKFTECNAVFEKKLIILFGTKRGVGKFKEVALNTLMGKYHPITPLRKLKSRFVRKNKQPPLDYDDWIDYLSNFPKNMLVHS